MEKLWAKVNGNYERTAAGWQHEALRVLSGAPSYDYLTESYTDDEIFAILKEADDKHYILGAGTAGQGDDSVKNSVGLSASHAYSILGAYELRDANGDVKHKILQIRNPWRFETYTGPWRDKGP